MNYAAFSTADNAYAGNSIVSLLSFKHWNPKFDLYVFSTNATKETIQRAWKNGITVQIVNLPFEFDAKLYPADCMLIFYAPQVLLKMGYTHSLYLDGDVYCNKSINFEISNIRTYAGVSIGSVPKILGIDRKKIKNFWKIKQWPKYRIQTGVLFFNNEFLEKIKFNNLVTNIYKTCNKIGAPRYGDDSLFSVFQSVYPKIKPKILSSFYNNVISKACAQEKNDTYHAKLIKNSIFFHFTEMIAKPWSAYQESSCFSAYYFARKWKQRMLDKLSSKNIEFFFKKKIIKEKLKSIAFFWWNDINVGDQITPYYLQKVCNLNISHIKKQNENTILNIQKINKKLDYIFQKIFKIKTKKIVNSILNKFYKKYIISTGSIIRLSSVKAEVYGSGISKKNQEVLGGDFRFVRGPLTRKRILANNGLCPPIYGDPALLLSRFYKPKNIKKKYYAGICPHFTEFKKIKKIFSKNKNVLVINMKTKNVEQVVNHILSCKKVFSSSLHGIVISHSYSIPVRWVKFSDQVFGDDSKFYDYFYGLGEYKIKPIDLRPFNYFNPSKYSIKTLCLKKYFSHNRIDDEMFFDSKGIRQSFLVSAVKKTQC